MDKKYVLYGITTVLLMYICVYIIRSRMNKSNTSDTSVKVCGDTSVKVCELFYFYTSWCPYCKKSIVEWNKFKAEWDHKTLNGYVLQFQEIDCDVNESTANKYNVTNYPTIKLIKDDVVIDFDAKPTVDSLTRFLSASFD
jgi:thiol-disulfide isomerase/thioredoxin